MHALVTLRHDSNVRLSYPIFRAACAKIMGGTVHFDAKLARGGESLEDTRQYIHKGKQAKAEEQAEVRCASSYACTAHTPSTNSLPHTDS